MTILEFASAVQRLAGTSLPIEHRPLPEDDPRVRRPDISRARQLLGWEPRVGFEDGMRRTLEWFRQRV
jgi:dTDP-glucose 4,6-dehydratase